MNGVATAIERFGCKTASVLTVFPQVAGPVLGTFLGRRYGGQVFNSATTGEMLGGISGGVLGRVLGTEVLPKYIEQPMADEHAMMPPMTYIPSDATTPPPDAPFALDPTTADIPPWALQGAQLLRPTLKHANEGTADILGGDTLGMFWPLGKGIANGEPASQVGKNILGQTMGILGGGFTGHLLGKGLDKLVGHAINVPVANIPLSMLLAGIGSTIGTAHGLRAVGA